MLFKYENLNVIIFGGGVKPGSGSWRTLWRPGRGLVQSSSKKATLDLVLCSVSCGGAETQRDEGRGFAEERRPAEKTPISSQ